MWTFSAIKRLLAAKPVHAPVSAPVPAAAPVKKRRKPRRKTIPTPAPWDRPLLRLESHFDALKPRPPKMFSDHDKALMIRCELLNECLAIGSSASEPAREAFIAKFHVLVDELATLERQTAVVGTSLLNGVSRVPSARW